MEGRAKDQHLAATRMDIGTDVNFGALTRSMFQHLKHRHGVEVLLQHEVQHCERRSHPNGAVPAKSYTSFQLRQDYYYLRGTATGLQ
jgi:malate dehydrogenase (quinone)